MHIHTPQIQDDDIDAANVHISFAVHELHEPRTPTHAQDDDIDAANVHISFAVRGLWMPISLSLPP